MHATRPGANHGLESRRRTSGRGDETSSITNQGARAPPPHPRPMMEKRTGPRSAGGSAKICFCKKCACPAENPPPAAQRTVRLGAATERQLDTAAHPISERVPSERKVVI